MRCIFAGTPEVAIPVLKALAESSHEVAAVLTRPDAPKGRGRTLYPSPVAEAAVNLGIPVIKANRITPEVEAELASYAPAVAVIVAYGALIPASALQLPTHGWLNLHYSLLPRWRGAAPVQRAIQAGDTVTGAAVFQLEEGLDTGPIFASLERPLSDLDTTSEVLTDLSQKGASLMVEVLNGIQEGSIFAQAQPDTEVTYAQKISREDAEISFAASASMAARAIHAVTSHPGAFTWRGDSRLKLGAVLVRSYDELGLEPAEPGTITATKHSVYVHCADALVELTTVAPAGKGWMKAADWARGARLAPGERLGRFHGEVA
ncbi:methionyl-tRNA formyltransferase [Boudabousia marimammalium]|uniref:Methionyl-tRNA formyltransferase n=1 Tax=Boudabousia marimammalium TaxID=156892 RepID=A0A1Q5PR82_9ACTO|nr:methionyl-tRNA formyltransferase [Boudabousia marimammalium]OKL49999.1 methionyl-tRNA formyltransferase [Boudabousia marimammalium]